MWVRENVVTLAGQGPMLATFARPSDAGSASEQQDLNKWPQVGGFCLACQQGIWW